MFDYSSFPIVETERLILRRMTEEDAPAILAEFGDPRVLEHLDPDPPVTDIESARSFLRWLMGMFDEKQALRWAITLRTDGTMIGTCGFHRWDEKHRRAEIGYDLAPAAWGQGYMSEALKAMLRHGFKQVVLHRVEALVYTENSASLKLLEKLNFQKEGLLRDYFYQGGRYYDHWLLSSLNV